MNICIFLVLLSLAVFSSGFVSTQTPQSKRVYVEPLVNRYNAELFGKIYVGSPPQELKVLFDTGSSNFWLPGEGCLGLNNRSSYNLQKSLTSEATGGEDLFLEYGRGQVLGKTVRDTVQIAGMTIKNVTFGQISQMSNISKQSSFDGLIGLGFPELATGKAPTFFQHLLDQKLIDEASYSLYMSDNNSVLIFGGVDKKYAKSEFKYFPVIDDGFWSIETDGLVIDDTIIELPNETKFIASFDSGTSRIRVSTQIGELLDSLIGLEENVNYGADIIESLPNISLKLGSFLLNIPPSSYMICDKTHCIYGIQASSGLPDPYYMFFGAIFLQTFYTHFDFQHKRIGFAKPRTN